MGNFIGNKFTTVFMDRIKRVISAPIQTMAVPTAPNDFARRILSTIVMIAEIAAFLINILSFLYGIII